MNIKRLLYYTDLICQKIDMHADAFIKRIEALKKGDLQTVEFIEKMTLEPLDRQISYLANKATELIEKERQHGK